MVWLRVFETMECVSEDKRVFELHAQVCKTLSSPRRLEIIHRLRDGEKPVSDLVKETGYPKANLSQHLSVMRASGVLAARRDGRQIYYRVAYPKMLQAYELLREILFEQMRERSEVLEGAPDRRRSSRRKKGARR